MSLTDVRSAYRDVFQTLRAVGRSGPNSQDVRESAADNRATASKRSEEPGVVVTLSGNRIEDDNAAKEDPRIQALEEKKGRARGQLVELAKRIKLARKIWQYQPKELAKQLVALAKQLKEILDDYKSAQSELAELRGGSMGGGMPAGLAGLTAPPPATGSSETETETADDMDNEAASAEAEAEVEVEAVSELDDVPEAASELETAEEVPPQPAFSYGDVKFERIRLDQTPEAFTLRGDIEFAKGAKELSGKLKEAFEDVKRWAIGFKQDSKDEQKFYDSVGKVLNKLDKELFDYVGELQRTMPPAIWVSRPVASPG